MALTPKQHQFALEVASGKTMTDAYKASYNAVNMKPAVIRTEASKLMTHPDIAITVERLRSRQEACFQAAVLSDKERVLEKLRHLLDNAQTESSQLRAAELLGKSVGMFKDVQVQEPEQRSSEELEAELAEKLNAIFGKDPLH